MVKRRKFISARALGSCLRIPLSAFLFLFIVTLFGMRQSGEIEEQSATNGTAVYVVEGRPTNPDVVGDIHHETIREVFDSNTTVTNPEPQPGTSSRFDHLKETCKALGVNIAQVDSIGRSIALFESRLDREMDSLANFSTIPRVSELRRAIGCLYLACYRAEKVAWMNRVENLLGRYFSWYIEAARRKEVLYFHHISKAGGSGVCSQAWLNGCRPPGDLTLPKWAPVPPEAEIVGGGNCWSGNFSDRFTWWPNAKRSPPDSLYSCEKRLEFTRKTGLNMMANEGYLVEGEDESPCGDRFLSLSMVREPISRVLSHVAHMTTGNWHLEEASECFKNKAKVSLRETPLKDIDLPCFMRVHYITTNNYMVRMMTGSRGFSKKPGKVSRQDLEAAKSTLSRFDVLLVLRSQREHVFPTDLSLFEKIGLGFLVRDRPSHVPNKRAYGFGLKPEEERFLRRYNEMDIELFELAEDLYELDSLAYNRTAEFCSRRQGMNGQGVTLACEAFNTEPIVSIMHPNHMLVHTRRLRKPHTCGCGWVGSLSTRRSIPPYIPLLTNSSSAQDCPRTTLFDRRGVTGTNVTRYSLSS